MTAKLKLLAGVATSLLLTISVAPALASDTPGSAIFGYQSSLNAGVSSDWDLAGDFTVEWFQYQTSQTVGPSRVFSVGSYADSASGARLGFSIEGTTAYVWFNDAYQISAPMACALNAWTHVAITRSGSNLSLYFNGVHQGTATAGGLVSSGGHPLLIGREENPLTADTYFRGHLSNFHFVNGTALYSGSNSFTPPAAPITGNVNTKLLVKFSSDLLDSSSSPKTLTAFSGDGLPTLSSENPWAGALGTCGSGGGGSGGGGFPGKGTSSKQGTGSGPGQGLTYGGKKK